MSARCKYKGNIPYLKSQYDGLNGPTHVFYYNAIFEYIFFYTSSTVTKMVLVIYFFLYIPTGNRNLERYFEGHACTGTRQYHEPSFGQSGLNPTFNSAIIISWWLKKQNIGVWSEASNSITHHHRKPSSSKNYRVATTNSRIAVVQHIYYRSKYIEFKVASSYILERVWKYIKYTRRPWTCMRRQNLDMMYVQNTTA